MIGTRITRRAVLALACLATMVPPAALRAQDDARTPRRLSLDDALHMAEQVSQAVAIAEAGVARARGQVTSARSQYFPQIYGSASYTRTLATQYSNLGGSSDTTSSEPPPDCTPFVNDPAWTTAMRNDSIAAAVNRAMLCPAAESPFSSFRNLPFGQANQYQLGLTLTQNVFTGGRIGAQVDAAAATRRSAEVTLAAAHAQLIMDVARAYYDAVLSERLVMIADSTLAQTQRTLGQTRLAKQVGNAPEFDLLRAQVSYNNQIPVVIQQRANRDLAYLRLKQLLELPLDDSVELTTELGDTTFTAGTQLASLVTATPDTAVTDRAPVRQARAAVAAQRNAVDIARAARIPSLTLSSSYGRVAYPTGGLPDWSQFRSNWTITAAVQLPIFTGGQLHADQVVAEANLREARAQLEQTRELAALDTRTAIANLRAAEASWRASSGTVDQAMQAYQIAEVRYREGISTQTELADSRLLLQQSRANRAQAARDLQVARLQLALIHDLPLSIVNGQQPATGTGTAIGTQQAIPLITPQMPGQTPQSAQPPGSVTASRTGAIVP